MTDYKCFDCSLMRANELKLSLNESQYEKQLSCATNFIATDEELCLEKRSSVIKSNFLLNYIKILGDSLSNCYTS